MVRFASSALTDISAYKVLLDELPVLVQTSPITKIHLITLEKPIAALSSPFQDSQFRIHLLSGPHQQHTEQSVLYTLGAHVAPTKGYHRAHTLTQLYLLLFFNNLARALK